MIGDFRSGEDLIVLRTGHGNAGTALAFIGDAAFGGAAGEIRYVQGSSGITVQIDMDGDRKADEFVHLCRALAITADDFLL